MTTLAQRERKLQAILPEGVAVHNDGKDLTVLVQTPAQARAIVDILGRIGLEATVRYAS